MNYKINNKKIILIAASCVLLSQKASLLCTDTTKKTAASKFKTGAYGLLYETLKTLSAEGAKCVFTESKKKLFNKKNNTINLSCDH